MTSVSLSSNKIGILFVVIALLLCGYILYDTSQIIHHYGPDEAILGVVSLYTDFLNLFFVFLSLCGIAQT